MNQQCEYAHSAALMAALLMAWPATAQEQRGTIEGVVKDASGAVLPGVTVEARLANGAVLTTTSDETGTYRFPSVAPGDYLVSATLDNFAPAKNDVVRVGLGQVKKVDFVMSPKGVTESVQVMAESPLVDVRQSARQTNIRAEQIELMPKGRDFNSVITQAPGANMESKLGGLSIDGASAGENRWIIDGIETTDVQDGTQGKFLIVDFVEEVQVKSSGYTAEFGGATGGVINAITKSGTNDWRGSALFNWQGDSLRGGNTPTLRRNLVDPLTAEYVTYPKDGEHRIEPGFSVGGPISLNRAWFFGAYQPAFTTNERQVDATTAVNPALTGTFDEDQKQKTHFITSKRDGPVQRRAARPVAVQQQLVEDRRASTLSDRHRPAGHELRLYADVPELVPLRQPGLGSHAETLLRCARRLLLVRRQRQQHDRRAPLSLLDRQQPGDPGVPENLRKATGFSSIPEQFEGDAG